LQTASKELDGVVSQVRRLHQRLHGGPFPAHPEQSTQQRQ
jgi:hypothetical protein